MMRVLLILYILFPIGLIAQSVCNKLNFDGIDDYVEVNSLATPLSGSTTNFTIEFWLKGDKNDQPSSIRTSLFSINPVTSNGNGLLIIFGGTNTQEGKIMIYDEGTSGTNADFKSTQVVGDNVCHHVAYVRTGNTGLIYIDGVQVGSHTTTYSILPSDLISIGQEWDDLTTTPATTQFFKGDVEDVRVWTTSRSQAQIQANMNNELMGNELGLLAYYKFNQGIASANNTSITQVLDETINGLNGNLIGFTLNGSNSNFIQNDCVLCTLDSCAQVNSTTFQKVYGGTGNERAHSVQQTVDGGFIIAGETTSFGAGAKDLFVMKINANGAVQWTKTYGESANDDGNSVVIKQTSDLGYILTGRTESFGAGSLYDSYILKLNNLGVIQWEKRIPGSSWDQFRDVLELSTGEFLLTGSAATFVSGVNDAHLVKISSIGNLIWIKNIGTASREHSTSIIELSNGNYAFSGNTNVSDIRNSYIVCTDTSGIVLWSKQYGASGTEEDFSDIIQLNSNNLLCVGWSQSFGLGGNDIWVVKTDLNGNIIWSKSFGGFNDDIGVNTYEKQSGNIIVTALSNSLGNNNEILVVNIDSAGNLLNTKSYGGLLNEELEWWGNPIQLLANEEYIIVGGTTSFGAGGEDIYVVKSNKCGESFCNENDVSLNMVNANVVMSAYNPSTVANGSLVVTSSIVNPINFIENTLCAEILNSCNLQANFSFVNLCLNDTTFFTDLSIDSIANIIDWKWFFGDGDSLIGVQNPSHIYLNSGNYNVTLITTNDSNCTDTIIIPIIINPIFIINRNDSICQGDSVFFGGSYQSTAGTYTDSLQSILGCDSIVITDLAVNSVFTINRNDSICQGDSLLLGGNYQTIAGTYTDSLQTINGCDSVVITDLIVNPIFSITQNDTICQGDSVLFNGNFYNTTGIYTDSLQTINGCDSLLTLELLVNPIYLINLNQNICQGDSILLGGSYQATAGTYTDSLQTINGCDSLIVTTLVVGNTYYDSLLLSICQGDSMFLGGSYQTTTGTYTDSLQTMNGCDSIVNTNLAVESIYSSIQNSTICQGDSLLFNGGFYNVSGVYTDSLQTVLGCDSLLILNLTVTPSFQNNVTQIICQGDSILLEGGYQNTTGSYTDSLQNINGCDSLIITLLTVGNTYNDSISESICQGDSILLGGSFQYNAGTYTDSLQSTLGCDSIVSTNLTVDTLITLTISDDQVSTPCNSIQLFVSGGSSYTWLPTEALSCVNCDNPIATPNRTTTYTVTENSNSCNLSESVTIFVEGESDFIIPNVFTPNFDNNNDGFNVKSDCISSLEKKVYNRWGQLLFQSSQINEPWNGRTTAGVEVPEGTYFYVITVGFHQNGIETQETFKGTVTLIR